jgi:hypothetical protein
MSPLTRRGFIGAFAAIPAAAFMPRRIKPSMQTMRFERVRLDTSNAQYLETLTDFYDMNGDWIVIDKH